MYRPFGTQNSKWNWCLTTQGLRRWARLLSALRASSIRGTEDEAVYFPQSCCNTLCFKNATRRKILKQRCWKDCSHASSADYPRGVDNGGLCQSCRYRFHAGCTALPLKSWRQDLQDRTWPTTDSSSQTWTRKNTTALQVRECIAASIFLTSRLQGLP